MMKRFLKSTSGNVAVLTGVLSIPLLIAAGAALDYTRLSNHSSSVQNAVDVATLAVAHEMMDMTDSEIDTYVKEYLEANLTADAYNSISSVTYDIDRDNRSLLVTAKGTINAAVMGIIGSDLMGYTQSAQIRASNAGLEVVLVLDTTGSMSLDGKMDALKDSAVDFSTQMLSENTASNQKVKVGIVPFARYVNVGTSNRNASWIDVEADTSEEICSERRTVISSSGCTTKTRYSDGVEVGTYEQCTNVTYSEPTLQCSQHTTTWNGCVGSREYPLNIQDSNYGTRVPGLSNTSCPNAITPLSGDKTNILSEINSLTTSGETYITTGVTWGVRTLSDGAPFGEGVSYSKAASDNITKAMVVMTDGENTQSKSSGSPKHNSNDKSEADDWLEEACAHAKSKNIQVFTIGFGASIANDTRDLLKNCSTDGDNYFHADDSSELQAAFDNIASKLTNLYLSM